MERTEHLTLTRARSVSRQAGLPLRLSDLVISASAAVAALYLVLFARWVPGWKSSATVFALISIGPPILRGVGRLFPRAHGVTDFLAAFFLLPAAVLAHTHFSPI